MSKFRLSYYTLLNILRRLEGSGQSMEYVIARSFQQFQFEQSLPQVRWPVVCMHSEHCMADRLQARGFTLDTVQECNQK